MSIIIKLDSPAVAALIEQDAEFRLELQRAVIAEITRKLYLSDVTGDVQKLIAEAFKSHKDDLVRAVKEDEAVRKLIDERLNSFIKSVRSGSFGYTSQKSLSDELKGMVNSHVMGLVREECERQLGKVKKCCEETVKSIQDEVMIRVGKCTGWVEHNVKVEMLKQIREDVASTIAATFGVKK
jgi:sugar-specific transcriptional regulator TrmB